MAKAKRVTKPRKSTTKTKASSVIRKPRSKIDKASANAISTEITSAPDVHTQAHIAYAMDNIGRHGNSRSVYDLSANTIKPNKKIKKTAKVARYGTKSGLPGPASDFAGPIVRIHPIGVSDVRQLLVDGPNNAVPNEWGVTNKSRMPMQNITPTGGGKHSGRTGPIR